MTTFEALTLLSQFSMAFIAIMTFIVTIIVLFHKKK
ncbi:MAG TPA: putative holin-like toxin [Virgibacillus sp.]|nr:putative holin-like toxin [Virgibacillus sp.]